MLRSGKGTGMAIATRIPVAALTGKSNVGKNGGGGGTNLPEPKVSLTAATLSDILVSTQHIVNIAKEIHNLSRFIFRNIPRLILTRVKSLMKRKPNDGETCVKRKFTREQKILLCGSNPLLRLEFTY